LGYTSNILASESTFNSYFFLEIEIHSLNLATLNLKYNTAVLGPSFEISVEDAT